MGKTLLNLPQRRSQPGEPTWEILDRFPRQGEWLVEQYLKLPEDGRPVEFNHGALEVLPMPTWMHQELAFLLCALLRAVVIDGQTGRAVLPPFHLRTGGQTFRLPDVMYLAPRSRSRFRPDGWDYADLVIEIVSPDDPARDYVTKRAEYAAAGVPEYWIVDPDQHRVLVLVLEQGTYREHANQPLASTVQSPSLPEIVVDLAAMIEQINREAQGA